jgi:hypothetical protein
MKILEETSYIIYDYKSDEMYLKKANICVKTWDVVES